MELIDYFNMLYDYNRWANERMLEAAARLAPEQLFHDHSHSWGSVHGLLVHMMSAEWIWLRRWQGESPKAVLNPDDFPTMATLHAHWEGLEADLRLFIAAQTSESLDRSVTYTNTKGRTFSLPLWQLMGHLANHSTHHRGELAAMFALLGVEHPEDDWYLYIRLKVAS